MKQNRFVDGRAGSGSCPRPPSGLGDHTSFSNRLYLKDFVPSSDGCASKLSLGIRGVGRRGDVASDGKGRRADGVPAAAALARAARAHLVVLLTSDIALMQTTEARRLRGGLFYLLSSFLEGAEERWEAGDIDGGGGGIPKPTAAWRACCSPGLTGHGPPTRQR